jgi:hypothetical protein
MPSCELIEKAEAGKIKLGGCCIIEVGDEYYCNVCGHEWNQEKSTHAAYSNIKTIKASVGGYFGGYYNIEIDLVNLKITWIHWGGEEVEEEKTTNKTIRLATAKKFIEQLKMVNLLNWKAKYIEPGICDGTQWDVEIITDGRTIKKHGNNMFPGEWDVFCRYIRAISGKGFR